MHELAQGDSKIQSARRADREGGFVYCDGDRSEKISEGVKSGIWVVEGERIESEWEFRGGKERGKRGKEGFEREERRG